MNVFIETKKKGMILYILNIFCISDGYIYNIYSGTKTLVYDRDDNNLKLIPEYRVNENKNLTDIKLVKINKNSMYIKINNRYIYAGPVSTTIGTTSAPVFNNLWELIELEGNVNLFKIQNHAGCVERGEEDKYGNSFLVFLKCEVGNLNQFFEFKKIKHLEECSYQNSTESNNETLKKEVNGREEVFRDINTRNKQGIGLLNDRIQMENQINKQKKLSYYE